MVGNAHSGAIAAAGIDRRLHWLPAAGDGRRVDYRADAHAAQPCR
jgi:hypothetical protein